MADSTSWGVVLLCTACANHRLHPVSGYWHCKFQQRLSSELIELHNHYRHIGAPCSTDRQLPTLKVNAKLNAAAADQARKMASENRLRHQDNLGMRVQQHGYRYRVVAENIAQAPFGGDQLMQLWLTSQGHCDNIFNQQVSEIGIAQQGEFWAVILAQPH